MFQNKIVWTFNWRKCRIKRSRVNWRTFSHTHTLVAKAKERKEIEIEMWRWIKRQSDNAKKVRERIQREMMKSSVNLIDNITVDVRTKATFLRSNVMIFGCAWASQQSVESRISFRPTRKFKLNDFEVSWQFVSSFVVFIWFERFYFRDI